MSLVPGPWSLDDARGASAPCDIAIVGAGAAGLATAIFSRTRNPDLSVVLLDGAKKPGAKILVSGGGRCNVTNTVVTERDYWGGPPPVVRRVLRGLSVRDTVAFFARAGVTLHEEHDGKLFPDSNRARDVLSALLDQAASAQVDLRAAHRVTSIAPADGRFQITTSAGGFSARRVVLATGGQSLPKTGSDGAGYALAHGLGHSIVPATPALAPLVLGVNESSVAAAGIHADLSGVSVDAALSLWVDGALAIRLRESLLWTHFGISGPVALNLSRHWLRARLDGRRASVTGSFVPGMDYERLEAFWLDERRTNSRVTVATAAGRLIPASLALAVLRTVEVDPATLLAQLTRESRRRLSRGLLEWPLGVIDSRGYSYAEATAGGVDLREIDPATMESRRCPGLYLVGEILDVDGRLGGFNFQWAWSSAAVAARGLSR